MREVSHAFRTFVDADIDEVTRITSGHIHQSYRVSMESDHFLLQRLNEDVFRDLAGVMKNAVQITTHLAASSDYTMAVPLFVANRSGDYLTRVNGNAWRCQSFIGDPRTNRDTQLDPRLVAEAFGVFSRVSGSLDAGQLNITIPDFHVPSRRWQDFKNAIRSGLHERTKVTADLIQRAEQFARLCGLAEQKSFNDVAHNDPKPSNIIANADGEPLAIIDFDTAMAGSHYDDFGDLVRSLCCTQDENTDPKTMAIEFSPHRFEEVLNGFAAGRHEIITDHLRESYLHNAAYIIYEQALRFLTDFLLGDVYYSTSYANQNAIRAENQMQLLESLAEKMPLHLK